MNKRRYLIKASLKKKIKSKWFLILNIIIFALILIIFNTDRIINIFGGNYNKVKDIYVYDNINIYNEFTKEFNSNNNDANYKYNIISKNGDFDSAKKEIEKNKDDLILIIDTDGTDITGEVYSYNGMQEYTKNLIETSLNNINRKNALQRFNITEDEYKSISKSVELKSNILYKKSNGDIKIYIATFILMIIILPGYFLITNLVQMIGSEINEEKATKSMEIIISNVKPKDHLIAKVISCTLFTIFQGILIIIYAGIGLVTRFGDTSSFMNYYSKVGTISGASASSNRLVASVEEIVSSAVTSNLIDTLRIILPIIIIFFIVTLISYAILSGVLASMSTNIDNFQQLQTPITIMMALGLYLAFSAAMFDGSIFIKVMSFVPMLSFLIAPTLFLMEQLSLIELITSLIIQVIFMIILYHYGLKIYKVGILNYQTTHLFKRMAKALKTVN